MLIVFPLRVFLQRPLWLSAIRLNVIQLIVILLVDISLQLLKQLIDVGNRLSCYVMLIVFLLRVFLQRPLWLRAIHLNVIQLIVILLVDISLQLLKQLIDVGNCFSCCKEMSTKRMTIS
jgi:hypothetical protein